MEIRRRDTGKPSEELDLGEPGPNLLIDSIIGQSGDAMYVRNVFCPPRGRTGWHSHKGQVLVVLAGEGKACVRGEKPQPIRAGDVIHFPADEVHWHGGGDDSYVVHLTIVVGPSEGHGTVTDEDFDA